MTSWLFWDPLETWYIPRKPVCIVKTHPLYITQKKSGAKMVPQRSHFGKRLLFGKEGHSLDWEMRLFVGWGSTVFVIMGVRAVLGEIGDPTHPECYRI